MPHVNESHSQSVISGISQITSLSGLSSIVSTSTRTTTTEKSCTSNVDHISEELDNLLAQLKLKQTFQEEDPQSYKSAGVLSSNDVSKIMGSFFGVEKKELDEDTRDVLGNLQNFFREYLNATKVSDGSKAKELLLEWLHSPEHLIFQELLCNEPNDWIGLGLNVIQDMIKKETLLVQLKKDSKDVQVLRRTVAKDIDLAKKDLEERKVESNKMRERMHPDNVRRLEISMEQFQREADLITETLASRKSMIKKKDLEDLMMQFEKLQERHNNAKQEYNRLSANGALPPDLNGARKALSERKSYLDAIIEQIENPLQALQVSSGSLNTSGF